MFNTINKYFCIEVPVEWKIWKKIMLHNIFVSNNYLIITLKEKIVLVSVHHL